MPAPSLVLSARDRAALKARAHDLEPVVRVGHAGLTPAVLHEVDRALEAHELIKVKLAEQDRDERAAMGASLVAETGAALVQRVGRIVILWRPTADGGSATR